MDNYIETQREFLINKYLKIVGFNTLESRKVKFNIINNENTIKKAKEMIPTFKTVFNTTEVSSLVKSKRKRPHLALNLLRQLLKTKNLKLKPTIYSKYSKYSKYIKDSKYTTSTMYRIVPI